LLTSAPSVTGVRMSGSHIKSISLLLCCFSILLPQIGFAQIEEITVTARKEAENLQEIPLAITAFDEETIMRRGINNLDDLARNTAGLVFDQGITSQDTRVVIRGLSPTRGRQNIAFLLDGIDISSEAINTAGGSLLVNPRYLDFERVEVVKGPQSALYGRAAFNGAINYVSKLPGDEYEASITADVAEYDQYQLNGAIGGPITKTFGLRGFAGYWSEDGYYDNPFTEKENLGGGDGYGLSLSGVWKPAETFSAKMRISWSDDQYEQRPAAFLPYNTGTIFNPDVIRPLWTNQTWIGAGPPPPNRNDVNDPRNVPANYTYEVCGHATDDEGTVLVPDSPGIDTGCANRPDADSNTIRFGAVTSFGRNNPEVITPTAASPVLSYTGQVPDTKDLSIRLSPDPGSLPSTMGTDQFGNPVQRIVGCTDSNPNCGKDYEGTGVEVFRTSLVLEWSDLGPGSLVSWTGYTDANQLVDIDFDKYAVGPGISCAGPDGLLGSADDVPNIPGQAGAGINCSNVYLGEAFNHSADPLCLLSGGDCAWGTQQINFDTDTTQFSQELRYISNLDGKVNFTLGANYWREDSEQQNSSTTARATGGLTGNFPNAGPDGLFGLGNAATDPVRVDDGTIIDVLGGVNGIPGEVFQRERGAGNMPNCNYLGIPGPIANPAYMPDFVSFMDQANQNFGVTRFMPIPTSFNALCPPNSAPIMQFLDGRTNISSRVHTADTASWSLYGRFDVDFSPAWRFSFEGRYLNEREEQIQPQMDTSPDPRDPSLPLVSERQSPSSGQPNCYFDPNDSVFPGFESNPDRICGDALPVAWDSQRRPIFNPDVDSSFYDTLVTTEGPFLTPPTVEKKVSTRTDYFTPRASLEWKPQAGQMYYLSYAIGRKPGGFSRLTAGSGGFTPEEAIFEPEKLTVYELGAKTIWLDNTLILNLAVFYQDFEDKQVPTTLINERTGLSGAAVVNAGAAEIPGLEIEATWAPTERLIFNLAYAYLDAEYTEFRIATDSGNDLTRADGSPYESATGTIPDGLNMGGACHGYDAQSGLNSGGTLPSPDIQCFIDLSGNKIEDVPEHSVNFVGRYQAPVFDTGLEWWFEVDYAYQDTRFLEQWNTRWLDSYSLVDLRLALQGDRWEAIAYVDNALEDLTVKSAQSGPGISSGMFFAGPPRVRDQVIAYPASPRVLGLRVNYAFGN
jgi:outer membrane receptor protein involved in Fe transport